jgi:hypothetical protein
MWIVELNTRVCVIWIVKYKGKGNMDIVEINTRVSAIQIIKCMARVSVICIVECKTRVSAMWIVECKTRISARSIVRGKIIRDECNRNITQTRVSVIWISQLPMSRTHQFIPHFTPFLHSTIKQRKKDTFFS